MLYASHFPVETFPDATSVSDKDLFPYIQAGSRYLKEKGHEINLLGWAKRKKERQGKNGPAVRKRTTQTPNMPDAKRRKVEAPPTTPVPAGKANQPEPKGSPKPQELEGDNGEILDEYAAQNRLSDASWIHWTDEEILTVARHALPDLKSAKSVAGCKLLLSLSAKGNTALLNAIAEDFAQGPVGQVRGGVIFFGELASGGDGGGDRVADLDFAGAQAADVQDETADGFGGFDVEARAR